MAYFGCCGVLKGESMINYSTSEQNTGIKWIDGKDIYQKTVAISGFDSYGVALDITGIDFLVDARAILRTSYSGTTSTHITSFNYNPNGWLNVRTVYENQGGTLYFSGSSGESFVDGYATAWYTKISS